MICRTAFQRSAALIVSVAATISIASVSANPASAAMSPFAFPSGSDPSANVAQSASYSSKCIGAPQSSACYTVLEQMLNAGRAAVGKSPYTFSSKFVYLNPREQMLVLTNQDRVAYGLPIVVGLNLSLQNAANTGANAGVDPSLVPNISGQSYRAYGSNVFTAINYVVNPLYSYFNWMYNDGPGASGSNFECRTPPLHNCWIHRHNNLMIFPSGTIAIVGVGIGSGHVTLGGTSYPTSSHSQLFEAFANTSAIPTVPTITSMSPLSGPHAGGTTVSIAGYGFRSVSSVVVCGVTASQVTVVSSVKLVLKTPAAHAAVVGHMIIHTTGGINVNTPADVFSYT